MLRPLRGSEHAPRTKPEAGDDGKDHGHADDQLVKFDPGGPPIETLVFQGGGTKGIVYAGVLRRLQESSELLQRVTHIAGTSAGAQTAALVAVGYKSEELRHICATAPWDYLLDGNSGCCGTIKGFKRLFRSHGYYKGDFLLNYIEGLIRAKTGQAWFTFLQLFEWTGMELSLGAANLTKRRFEFLNRRTRPHMPISKGVRASSSIPWVFVPVEYSGQSFIDGGIYGNLPTSAFPGTKSLAFSLTTQAPQQEESLFASISHFSHTVVDMVFNAAQADKGFDINTDSIKTFSKDNNVDIVVIQCGNAPMLKTNMSDCEVAAMVEAGYTAVDNYLEHHPGDPKATYWPFSREDKPERMPTVNKFHRLLRQISPNSTQPPALQIEPLSPLGTTFQARARDVIRKDKANLAKLLPKPAASTPNGDSTATVLDDGAPMTEGRKVVVEIVAARNLLNKNAMSLSDPYVVCHDWGNKSQFRTQTAVGNLSPIWEFSFEVENFEDNAMLEFAVLDGDHADFLGRATLHSSSTTVEYLHEELPLVDMTGRPIKVSDGVADEHGMPAVLEVKVSLAPSVPMAKPTTDMKASSSCNPGIKAEASSLRVDAKCCDDANLHRRTTAIVNDFGDITIRLHKLESRMNLLKAGADELRDD